MSIEFLHAARDACRHWLGDGATTVARLTPAGFSGAPVFTVHAPERGQFVLKPFPETITAPRAAWIHALMMHARRQGVGEVPEPLATATGATVVPDAAGRLWEMIRFVDGAAEESPTGTQAAAAGRVLGRLHAAAATFADARAGVGPSPGLLERAARARALVDHPWSRRSLPDWASDGPAREIAGRRHMLAPLLDTTDGRRLLNAITRLGATRVPRQPVLRDVWSDHVLFGRDDRVRVAGILDFHAAGIDTPALDIARLLGSWRPPPDRLHADVGIRWPEAIAAYGDAARLSSPEMRLLPWLHACGVVLGLDNWFRWILDERREFADWRRVLERVDRLAGDVPLLVRAAAEWGLPPV